MGQHHKLWVVLTSKMRIKIVYGDRHATSGIFLQNAVANYSEFIIFSNLVTATSLNG